MGKFPDVKFVKFVKFQPLIFLWHFPVDPELSHQCEPLGVAVPDIFQLCGGEVLERRRMFLGFKYVINNFYIFGVVYGLCVQRTVH